VASYTSPYAAPPPPGTIAELILKRGQIRGDAERRSGEASAQMWSNVGQQASGTLGELARYKMDEPARLQQAQARDLQIQASQGQLAQQQQATQDRGALDQALSLPDRASALAATPGHLRPEVEKHYAELDESAAKLKAARATAQAAEADYWGSLAAKVKPYLTGPDGGITAAQMALGHAKEVGYAEADDYLKQIQANPMGLSSMVDSLIQASPAQRELSQKDEALGIQKQSNERATETARINAENIAADNRRQAAAEAETQRHNRVTESRQNTDAAAVPVLSPQGLDAAAKMYAQTGQLPAMGMSKEAAKSRASINNRAAELFPDLNVAGNKADYGAVTQTLTQLTKQRGAITSFENTAKKNIKIFLETAGKVVDTGSPLANRLVRQVSGKALGSADQAAYDAARQVAINEIAKITSNPTLAGQLSDAARKEVEDFNPAGATLKQSVAVMRLLVRDMDNRTSSLDESIAEIKGRVGGRSQPPKGPTNDDPLGILGGAR
jgi:hypothetical protein